MPKKFCFGFLSVLTAIVLATGCKPKAPNRTTTPPRHFQTPFQSESQFIVEAIVSDLAEQMYYAANHRLPEAKYFSVTATEKPGSPLDAPVYELQINLDQKPAGLKLDLNVNGPIWSPGVYGDVAAALARAVGLKPPAAHEAGNTALLSKLLNGTPETIERENQALSGALEEEFTNPVLHEQAALLLGAFLLRDHSGTFFEIRSPLSRVTAHLAMARFLDGAGSYGINGQLAEAMQLTLVGDETLALNQLKSLDTNSTFVAGMVRALQARNTGDYRPLTDLAGRSRVESVAWFAAMADYISAPIAWPKLDDDQKQIIDFVRVAHEENYSVEMGHQLLRMSIPLELQEIQSVYELSHRKKLSQDGLVPALNELPERCFITGSGGAVHVRIIGWGQWAMFFQRHLCHAVQQNYYFMKFKWGVPDDAKEYADRCEQELAGLRLYPFVQKFNCTNAGPYRKSVDDCFKVIVAAPQLVPAGCWNWLNMRVSYAPMYVPQSGPLVNEWHDHNPPPGTAYDLGARLYQQSLLNHADPIGHFLKLHQMAPYDCRIPNLLITRRFNNHPTYDQAMALYDAVLPYSVTALQTVANTCYSNQPDQYEKWMLRAAELNPACYYNLANFAWYHTNDDKAALYIDKACDTDPDSVRVANHTEWRVRYYLKKSQTDKAREIADFAGEVYSHRGLVAKAVFMESTSNYDGAFEWFAKIEERYDKSFPLMEFCQRYKKLTGDARFDAELQKRIPKLFPKGIEKVSLGNFHKEPADGVLIRGKSDLLRSAGMKPGNVIVAINGVCVHNFEQYCYVLESLDTPELDLIVWQGTAYHEIKSSPPNHRFGVDFGDYKPFWAVKGKR
jgi:tetratricopeptide (TPR) repeat protein